MPFFAYRHRGYRDVGRAIVQRGVRARPVATRGELPIAAPTMSTPVGHPSFSEPILGQLPQVGPHIFLPPPHLQRLPLSVGIDEPMSPRGRARTGSVDRR